MRAPDEGPERRGGRARRVAAVIGLAVVLVAGVGYAAVSTAPVALSSGGPTSVSGTEASAVFTIEDRTVRQVRYRDGATLDYRFRITNDQALPVTVTGISSRQRNERLFGYLALEDGHGSREFTVPGNGSRSVHLLLRMSGCESLSARAGSFAHEVRLDTERLGVSAGTATVVLPEEVHTGSPREAFCPKSTAKSRPPG